jgi:hypothetical protein
MVDASLYYNYFPPGAATVSVGKGCPGYGVDGFIDGINRRFSY